MELCMNLDMGRCWIDCIVCLLPYFLYTTVFNYLFCVLWTDGNVAEVCYVVE